MRAAPRSDAVSCARDRAPYRPAHIQFIVTAPGYRLLIRHIFVAGGAYVEPEAVFAVKKSLITGFTPAGDAELAARYRVVQHKRMSISCCGEHLLQL